MRDSKSETPGTVWHYTNWSGLDGILRTGKIWASHVFYLNDTFEIRQATKTFGKVLNDKVPNHLLVDWRLDGQHVLESTQALSVYVASFSTEGDDLSQWRGYGSPPPGFSLGFDFEKLTRLAGAAKCRLVACEYDRHIQRHRLSQLVDAFNATAAMQPKNDGNFEKRLKGIKWKLMQQFAAIAPEFKSGRFAAEREWRLITGEAYSPRNLDFHLSKSLVVPHCEIEIRRETVSALTAVRIGPSPHMRLMDSSIKSLLSVRKFDEVEVFRSKVPYRNW